MIAESALLSALPSRGLVRELVFGDFSESSASNFGIHQLEREKKTRGSFVLSHGCVSLSLAACDHPHLPGTYITD